MRADRVVSMMLLLESRGRMTAKQLAEELSVSRRTVMRDIEALGMAGVPIYSTRGRDGGFHIWEGFRSQLRGITAEEAAALSLLGTEELASQLGLGDAVGRVRLKIEQALTPELANEMATINQRFHHDAMPMRGEPPSKAIAFFEVAVRRRRVVRTSTPDEAGIELHPLGIVLKAGEWFLVAELHGDAWVSRSPIFTPTPQQAPASHTRKILSCEIGGPSTGLFADMDQRAPLPDAVLDPEFVGAALGRP